RTRSAGESLMARLGWAPTGTSAYRQWCADQARDGLTGLLLRFPVLGRLLSVTTTNWARTTAAMVTRVDRHRHELSDIFGIPIDSFVTAVFPGLSDSHRGGHS